MFADRTHWNLENNRLSHALSQHRAAGKALVDMTLSNPTECGFEYDRDAILRAFSNPAALKYEPSAMGLAVARGAIRDYYASSGYHISNDSILLTTGTSEAYSFIFRALCNPQDEVMVPAPGYPLFTFLADILDVKLVHYPLNYDHGWQIDFHALQSGVTPRTRAIVVVHPNNPTGHFAKVHEIAHLNQICAGHDLALIADEVFRDFALGEAPPASFVANSRALTFTVSGISKICGLPQMKASWMVLSGPVQHKADALRRLEMIADTYLSMNAPVQLAIPEFLGLRHKFQEQLMARVRNNLKELDRKFDEKKICARRDLEGGWNAVLRVPATRTDEDLVIELLTTRDVLVHPGYFYDFPSDGNLVVSLITPEKTFAEGIQRLLSLF
ncbi:MAG: pyridoxal phosphate-dependent aminotransferase [Candidatus Acidiferrales bacterium]